MGWSRHWYRPLEIEAGTYARIREDMLRVIRESSVPIRGWDGALPFDDSDPDVIAFNGIPSCETFLFGRVHEYPGGLDHAPYEVFDGERLWFWFAKTWHLPYDEVVAACLLVAKHHLGKRLQISSDGGRGAWDEGAALVREALGYDVEVRLPEDEIETREPWPHLRFIDEPRDST
jgi:hypothetical protein